MFPRRLLPESISKSQILSQKISPTIIIFTTKQLVIRGQEPPKTSESIPITSSGRKQASMLKKVQDHAVTWVSDLTKRVFKLRRFPFYLFKISLLINQIISRSGWTLTKFRRKISKSMKLRLMKNSFKAGATWMTAEAACLTLTYFIRTSLLITTPKPKG